MSFFDTEHKRKSVTITASILAVLVLLMFFYGLGFYDPPKEYGIAINYGTSDVGREKPKTIKKVKTAPKPPVQEEKVEEEVVKEEIPKETIKEEVVTSDQEDTPVIEKPKEEEKKEEPKKEVVKEKPKPKPKKPSENTMKAFDNLLNGDKSDGEPKGEGDDKEEGLKGKEDGNPNSPNFYGNKGGDKGDPNYSLAGRGALNKPKEQPDCQETGIVKVSVTVDENGNVIDAKLKVKGSTNTVKCLVDPAIKAALNTKWTKSPDGSKRQIGTITYNFTLTK